MKINVILINPWIKNVSKVEVETTDIDSLYKVMSWLGHEVQDVTVAASFPNGDNILMENTVHGIVPAFSIGLYRINGCGVIMGNNNSEWDEPMFMLTEIQDYVRFFK